MRTILFVALLSLTFIAESARADLITFDIDYTFGSCFFCFFEESTFEEESGLNRASFPVDVSARFTVDTSLDNGSGNYFFDSPGTGLSITVGLLTLFFDDLRLTINIAPLGGSCSAVVVEAGEVFAFGAAFTFTDCASDTPGSLSDTSLSTFVHADLSQFGPGVGDPSVGNGSWLLFGQGQTATPAIVRVSEPAILALLGIGLAGIGCVGRRKLTR